MKFHQLPVGTRFRYQERAYRKTTPLAASGEDGSQRVIPRSAIVSPIEDTPPGDESRAAGGPLHDALQAHHARCRDLLSRAAAQLPEITRLEILKELEDSYRELQGALRSAG